MDTRKSMKEVAEAILLASEMEKVRLGDRRKLAVFDLERCGGGPAGLAGPPCVEGDPANKAVHVQRFFICGLHPGRVRGACALYSRKIAQAAT